MRQNLLGEMGGLRSWLGRHDVTFYLTETSKYLANLRARLSCSGDCDGLTTTAVQVDMQKAFRLPGGLFNVGDLQIHGQNLSVSRLGTLNTASRIEAEATTRLWALWYQQSFLNKRVDVKTAVLVTHDKAEAPSSRHEVAVPWNGKLIWTASPQTLYRQPATRELAAFIGDAVLLRGVAESDVAMCPFDPLNLAAPVVEGPVDVMHSTTAANEKRHPSAKQSIARRSFR